MKIEQQKNINSIQIITKHSLDILSKTFIPVHYYRLTEIRLAFLVCIHGVLWIFLHMNDLKINPTTNKHINKI